MPEPAKAAEPSADVHEVSLVVPTHFVRLLWLSRKFGQHPATLAGMASTVAKNTGSG